MSSKLKSDRPRPPAVPLLREWLKDEEMTQKQLAEKLDVSDSLVWAWLGGTRRPSIRLAGKLQTLTLGAVPIGKWLETPEPVGTSDEGQV